jgi:four helix bundle protein
MSEPSEPKINDSSEQIVRKVMKLVESLPKDYLAEVTGQQLLNSAISFDANYRDVYRDISQNKLAKQLKVIEKQADETLYWLESVIGSEFISRDIFLANEKDIDFIIEMLVKLVKNLRSELERFTSSKNIHKAA